MDTEIIIAGGGLVGNALAIALAQGGLSVAVIDPLPREQQLANAFDGRTSAISSGTVRILTHLGVWQHIAPQAQPIHDIRVCDQDKPGFVHYSDKEIGEPFGYIIENNIIRRGLYTSLEAESRIKIIQSKVVNFTTTQYSVTAELESGERLTAPLLIAADGRFSKLRDQASIPHRVISYDQTAIVCVIEHEHAHEGLALEKFYPEGPFALLPLKPKDGVNRSGVVWTEHENDATNFLGLSDADFNAELQRRIGDAPDNYWGKVTAIGKRFAYPLKLMHASAFTADRFALVGDAAHGIHPIAGQGVNLGYRDVAVLAELLIDQRKLGLDLGAESVLNRYQRWRRFDSMSMTASTDLLNRLFSNNVPGLSLVRRAGMVAVNNIPSLKRYFMKHAMGLIGDLPKMMQEDKATKDKAA
ncbi:MAG: UbiH/UbiF/VisC/COQ6 family ubiquinone biosynthesis hydroxylase [Rickettsiales bacterium]